MYQYSTGIDEVEKNVRGRLVSNIRHSDWRSWRECAITKILRFVGNKEMCCTSSLRWLQGRVDIRCTHSKVRCLFIRAIRLRSNNMRTTHH